MFGSEKKKLERRANEERRIAEAGSRERARVEAERAERAGKAPSSLRKIEYLDGKLNERDYKKGEKRVERAQKREAKNIRKEKNRKYWWLLLVLIALLIGCAAGYLLNGHFNHRANLDVAEDLIVAKDYEAAEMVIGDMKYKDSQKLKTYVQLRTGMDSYMGKLDEYLTALQDLESFDNKEINTQYSEYVEKVKPAGELQGKINELNIESLNLADKEMIDGLDAQVDELSDKYKDLIDTKKLKEAQVKMATLEEAAEQLKNRATQDENAQEPTTEPVEETEEDEYNTDETDAP